MFNPYLFAAGKQNTGVTTISDTAVMPPAGSETAIVVQLLK